MEAPKNQFSIRAIIVLTAAIAVWFWIFADIDPVDLAVFTGIAVAAGFVAHFLYSAGQRRRSRRPESPRRREAWLGQPLVYQSRTHPCAFIRQNLLVFSAQRQAQLSSARTLGEDGNRIETGLNNEAGTLSDPRGVATGERVGLVGRR